SEPEDGGRHPRFLPHPAGVASGEGSTVPIVDPLHRAVVGAVGSSITSVATVGGGDVAQAFRFELRNGRRAFAKTHPDPPPGFFTTEAAGLRWLREAGAVRVPEVLAVSDGGADTVPHLVLEWIEVGPPAPDTEVDLGRAL